MHDGQTLELERLSAGVERARSVPLRRPRLPQAQHSATGFWRFDLAEQLARAFAHRRLIILLPFAMIGGLAAYASLPAEPPLWVLPTAAVALLGILILPPRSLQRVRALTIALCTLLGFALLPLHGALFGTSMLSRPVFAQFDMRVDEILSASPTERRIIVSSLRTDDPKAAVTIRRARLFLPPTPPLGPGDTIHAKLRLAPVAGPVIPGGFDTQFQAYFDGVGAYGNTIGALTVTHQDASFNPARWIDSLRRSIGQRIDLVLTGEAAAIGWAMVVGDQSTISDETRQVMANAGLAHVYSISGLHMSLVAGGVFALLRVLLAAHYGLAQRLPVKRIAAAGGIVTALGYLLLAGGLANTPALRSMLMLALVFGAVLAGRRALTMRNVAIAAMAIILIDPASVFRASFQLSFAAVVGLIGVYEAPRRKLTGKRGWFGTTVNSVWTTALTSLIAGAATLLFSAYHFQQTAPLGVIGNLLALPVVGLVIMPSAMLALIVMPLGLDGTILRVMGWGIDRMLDISRLVAGWSEGLTANPLLTVSALLMGLAALGWFAFLEGRWRYLGPALLLPAVLLFGFDQRPDLLIADATQAVALRTDSGLALLAGKADSFAVSAWSQQYQETIAPNWPGLTCDSIGCIATTGQFSLSLVKSADAFAEDCAANDLIVTRLYAPAYCKTETAVIDAAVLASGGVQWLRWNDGKQAFDIRAAIPNLARPWRVLPR